MRPILKWLGLSLLVLAIIWVGTGAAGFDRKGSAAAAGSRSKPQGVGQSGFASDKAAKQAAKNEKKADHGASLPNPEAAAHKGQSVASPDQASEEDKGLAQAIGRTSGKHTAAADGLENAAAQTGHGQTQPDGDEPAPDDAGNAADSGGPSAGGQLTPKQVAQLIEAKAAVIIGYRYARATDFKSRDLKIRRLDGGAVVSGRGSFKANRIDYEASFVGTAADGDTSLLRLDPLDPEFQSFGKTKKQKGANYNTAMLSAEGKVGLTELSTMWQNGVPSSAFNIGAGGRHSLLATFNSSLPAAAATRLAGQVQVVVWRK